MAPEDLHDFFREFQDFLAPKLDTYEQAIYLYIFRQTRFIGLNETVVGFKSARSRMACGVGEAGKPMSENSVYTRVASLQAKGCIKVVQTEHAGRRIQLNLPREIPGTIPVAEDSPDFDLEIFDFFENSDGRKAILEREKRRCFYTLKIIDEKSAVLDHVISRPHGTNSYRNLVAASREANNRKGAMNADDFVRRLFREGMLSEAECKERLGALEDLVAGRLIPPIGNCRKP